MQSSDVFDPVCGPPRLRRSLTLSLTIAVALLLSGCAGTGGTFRDAGTREASAVSGGGGGEVVLQALAQVGKPYRWGGSSPDEGFDCSGLVAHVYEDALGIRLPRTSRQMSTRGNHVSSSALAAGDLVFFNTSRKRWSHVGIYIGDGRFVHAPSTGSLVRVERIDKRYWASRFNGARRIVSADGT